MSNEKQTGTSFLEMYPNNTLGKMNANNYTSRNIGVQTPTKSTRPDEMSTRCLNPYRKGANRLLNQEEEKTAQYLNNSKRSDGKDRETPYRMIQNNKYTNRFEHKKTFKCSILPEEGYIYKKEMDVINHETLTKEIRAIRGNRELKYIPSDMYLRYKTEIDEKNEMRRKGKVNENKQDSDLIGDPLFYDEEWPSNSSKLRVTFHNVAGICPKDNF